MALTPKAKKILKWTGIGAGGVVAVLAIWLLVLWVSAGSEYEKELETLVPQSALMLTRLDDLGTNWPALDDELATLISKHPNAIRLVEASPLYASLFGDEEERKAGKVRIHSIKQLHEEKMRGAIEDAKAQVTQMPGGLDLYQDLIGKQLVIAMVGEEDGEKMRPLILTRVSKTVRFGWNFKGFGTGERGQTTIAKQDGALKVTTSTEGGESNEMFIGLFDDVLVIARSQQDLLAVKALHDGDGTANSFADADGYSEALEEVKASQESGGWIRQFANLNAIRAWQGRDPNDPLKLNRSRVDQVFDMSPEVIQLSPELMPSINAIYRRAIDMRVFSFAAWNINTSQPGRLVADQFLIISPANLRRYSYLKPALEQKPAKMDFLDILPQGTWLIAIDREPFGSLVEAVKPQVGPDGQPKPDAVSSFFKCLGPDPRVEAAGIALLPDRLQPNPNDPRKAPPRLVSPVPLPGFAVMLRWPGVRLDDAERLLRETLREQGAKNLMPRRQPTNGGEYVTFSLIEDDEKLRWLTQFSAFTAGDYLLFCYSDNCSAAQEVFAAIADKTRSMRGLNNSVFSQFGDRPVSTLTYLDPGGLAAYSAKANLANGVGKAKFNEQRPFGKELRQIRAEEAAARGWNMADQRLDDVLEKIKRDWQAQQAPFEREFRQNIESMKAFDGIMVATSKSTARLHSHYILRLSK